MNQIGEKWEEIKQHIKTEYDLSPVSFNTWIQPLKFHDVDHDTVQIVIPSDQAHAVSYISAKYKNYFQVSISEMFNHEYNVSFLLEKDIHNKKENEEENYIYNINSSKANLNPKYNFDTFVVGSNNKFAHSAALAVAESPGEVYNPLFLYGGAGLGKTHLMHSIGHFVLEHNSEKKVLYVNSEQFTNEVIESIRSGNAASMTNLREKYRTIDVLLLDDVQFIIGKESTQEEFFHTFNELHEAKKQIVISSDKHPREISTLEERLRSRFEWGITADIQPPDYETKMAILKKRAELENLEIDTEVMQYVATNITSNIRELEGALNKICVFANLENRPVTLSLAEEALKDIIETQKEITPEVIMDVVAEHYNITVSDILSRKKNKEIANPRQICMYLSRKYTNTSLQAIGKIMGNRDHTTVMHGSDKIADLINRDEHLKSNIDILIKKLNPPT